MIADLLDLTRTRLGAGSPIVRKPTDLESICWEVALEIQAFHPDAQVSCLTEGDLRGEWDPDRLSQVVSNLVGHALQHGDGGRVEVAGRDAVGEVVLTVHNEGPSIPSKVQQSGASLTIPPKSSGSCRLHIPNPHRRGGCPEATGKTAQG
ncbi:MAG: ATP-binding protein [Acidobacteriota bacterium]